MTNLISNTDTQPYRERQGPLGPHFFCQNGQKSLVHDDIAMFDQNLEQTDSSPRHGEPSDLTLDNLEITDSNYKCSEFELSQALGPQRIFFKNSLLVKKNKAAKQLREQLARKQKSPGFEFLEQDQWKFEWANSNKISKFQDSEKEIQNSSFSGQNELLHQRNRLESWNECEDYQRTPFKIQISGGPFTLKSPQFQQEEGNSSFHIRRNASSGLNFSSQGKKDTPNFYTINSNHTNDPNTSPQIRAFRGCNENLLQIETPEQQNGNRILIRTPHTQGNSAKISDFLLSPESLKNKRHALLLGQDVSAMKSYASEETENYSHNRKRKNYLLKRWREEERTLKVLNKSGIVSSFTGGRKNLQKKKSYFSRKKESRHSPIRTGLISELFPADSDTAFIIPQNKSNLLGNRTKREDQYHSSGSGQDVCREKCTNLNMANPVCDQSMCSTAVGINSSWMPQNASWNCHKTLQLLTPNSSLLNPQNKARNSQLRKSVDIATRYNPFLSATPYRNRKSRDAECFMSPSTSESGLHSPSGFSSPLPKPIQRSPQTPKVEKTRTFYPQILEIRAQATNKQFCFASDSDPALSPRICEPRAKRHSEPIIHSPCQEMLSTSRFATDFKILERLGQGKHGTVYRCRNRIDCMQYAVKKRCQKLRSAGHLKEALSEIYAFAAISSEDNSYIVKYFSGWAQQNELYIVMELCRSSLHERVLRKKQKNKVFQEEEIKRIMRDVALGLSGLHSRQIVHLDIKPQNVLRSFSGKYKLGDMGLARVIKQDTDIQEGDSRYLAKELLNEYSSVEAIPDLRKADIFSLGAMMYELMSGRDLAINGNEWHRLRSGAPDIKIIQERGYSEESCAWVLRMLSPDIEVRPSCEELLSSFLQSPLEKRLQEEQARRVQLEARLQEVKLKLSKYELASFQF